MSEKNTEGNNILPFKPVAKRVSPAAMAAAVAETREMLIVYDHLIALLRETYDEGLDTLTDNLVVSVVGWRAQLADDLDDQSRQKLVKEMRDVLHQMPGILRSLLPGLGPRLGESMERKLGIQFSKY
jgi:hypothetical protein